MQTVLRFGGRLTDIGRECTHIVSPRVTRTVKFLSGISVCRHIVSPAWVEECGRQGRFVDETDFVLQDRDAEEMFDMNVADSLSRARKKKLLTVATDTFYNFCITRASVSVVLNVTASHAHSFESAGTLF